LNATDFYFLSVNENKMDWAKESNKLKSSAHQKLATLKPDIK
jgi:hypothetical protein